MASLQLVAASLINESWVVFGSSIGFRNKRFRRVSKRWRFRVQQMSVKEQMSKQELARFAKRSESLRRILKQYGVSVENSEENKTSSRLDDLNCEEKQYGVSVENSEENSTSSGLAELNCEEKRDVVPSSDIGDSKMNTTEELPDLRRQKMYSEIVRTAENLSGQNHYNLHHLKTGVLFTSLLPVLGFCIICITGTLHTIISRKASQGHHNSSKRTRWRTALSDWNEALASDEHDSSSPEYRVGSTNQEATDEANEAYSKVELEYKRFLLECGLSEF